VATPGFFILAVLGVIPAREFSGRFRGARVFPQGIFLVKKNAKKMGGKNGNEKTP